MGACSSRPQVLEDAPLPGIDHRTSEETTAVEAAAASDINHAVLEKEEIFQDTFDHIPEEMQVPTNNKAEAVVEEVPLLDEKLVVEAKATPAAADVPTESEDVNKVQEVDGVKDPNQEKTVDTDHDVPDINVPKRVDPVAELVEAADDSLMPESEGKPNTLETLADNVQEVRAPYEPKGEEKSESLGSVGQPLTPETEASQEGSGAPAAVSVSEGKAGISESAAQPTSGNPLQAFMTNVTKGWGWH